jgi:hypothetical protein
LSATGNPIRPAAAADLADRDGDGVVHEERRQIDQVERARPDRAQPGEVPARVAVGRHEGGSAGRARRRSARSAMPASAATAGSGKP